MFLLCIDLSNYLIVCTFLFIFFLVFFWQRSGTANPWLWMEALAIPKKVLYLQSHIYFCFRKIFFTWCISKKHRIISIFVIWFIFLPFFSHLFSIFKNGPKKICIFQAQHRTVSQYSSRLKQFSSVYRTLASCRCGWQGYIALYVNLVSSIFSTSKNLVKKMKIDRYAQSQLDLKLVLFFNSSRIRSRCNLADPSICLDSWALLIRYGIIVFNGPKGTYFETAWFY